MPVSSQVGWFPSQERDNWRIPPARGRRTDQPRSVDSKSTLANRQNRRPVSNGTRWCAVVPGGTRSRIIISGASIQNPGLSPYNLCVWCGTRGYAAVPEWAPVDFADAPFLVENRSRSPCKPHLTHLVPLSEMHIPQIRSVMTFAQTMAFIGEDFLLIPGCEWRGTAAGLPRWFSGVATRGELCVWP